MTRLLVAAEGQGDVAALRLLVRRIFQEKLGIHRFEIEIHRRHDLSHLRANDWANFRRYLQAAFKERCPVIWAVDCDDDCAWEVAREMSAVAEETGVAQPFAVALWVKEYESLFLTDFEATRAALGLPDSAVPPEDPESVRGAKGWINRQMPKSAIYKEPIDQPRITARLDLDHLMMSSRCYRHFAAALEWLVTVPAPAIYPITARL